MQSRNRILSPFVFPRFDLVAKGKIISRAHGLQNKSLLDRRHTHFCSQSFHAADPVFVTSNRTLQNFKETHSVFVISPSFLYCFCCCLELPMLRNPSSFVRRLSLHFCQICFLPAQISPGRFLPLFCEHTRNRKEGVSYAQSVGVFVVLTFLTFLPSSFKANRKYPLASGELRIESRKYMRNPTSHSSCFRKSHLPI